MYALGFFAARRGAVARGAGGGLEPRKISSSPSSSLSTARRAFALRAGGAGSLSFFLKKSVTSACLPFFAGGDSLSSSSSGLQCS
jgi:hypothetical protein